jgi:hypothetical protein
VVPLIDPAVGGEATENANSNSSIVTPFSADGLSVAQVMVAQGFANFTAVAVDGTKQDASALGGASAASVATVGASNSSSATTVAPVAAASSSLSACGGTTMITITRAVCQLIILENSL